MFLHCHMWLADGTLHEVWCITSMYPQTSPTGSRWFSELGDSSMGKKPPHLSGALDLSGFDFFRCLSVFLLQSLDSNSLRIHFTCYLGSLGPAQPSLQALLHGRRQLFGPSSTRGRARCSPGVPRSESANPLDVSSPRHPFGVLLHCFWRNLPKLNKIDIWIDDFTIFCGVLLVRKGWRWLKGPNMFAKGRMNDDWAANKLLERVTGHGCLPRWVHWNSWSFIWTRKCLIWNVIIL